MRLGPGLDPDPREDSLVGHRLPYSPTFREYGTARMLLAGEAEVREEEYMASGSYTRP